MDHASHEDWPVARLAEVSAVSAAHFARSFKQAFGLPPHTLPAEPPHRTGRGDVA